jgi:hypothetical protein
LIDQAAAACAGKHIGAGHEQRQHRGELVGECHGNQLHLATASGQWKLEQRLYRCGD